MGANKMQMNLNQYLKNHLKYLKTENVHYKLPRALVLLSDDNNNNNNNYLI